MFIGSFAPALSAQLNIPSDGSDGSLVITASTNIDLGKAINGVWSNSVILANMRRGIYDAEKWAVVFKYSSVSIASGATVTFSNHPTRAPVVWLVKGSVTIDGTLNLDGRPYTSDPFSVPEPGPGGFRGGARDLPAYGLPNGSGFGPGGYFNDNGYYGSLRPYGNPQIVPLIGGSGGSGWHDGSFTGGGGGGAILIAAVSNITVNGTCSANGGGNGVYWGSGGAIRLVADQILGNGRVEAVSVYPGRIRLEANALSTDLTLNPPTVKAPPAPLVIWPDTNAPTVKVVSVAGQAAPNDPTAPTTAPFSELTIASTNFVTVVLQTSNFPTNGTVNVYLKPRNAPQSILTATFVGGNMSQATWQVATNLLPAYTVIQARAVAN